MTYRELRRKLEVLGCRFQRQADGSHELWVNPANGRGPPFPGTGTVICPPAPSTEFAETRESPGQTSTRHRPKPPRSSSHRAPGINKNTRQTQAAQGSFAIFPSPAGLSGGTPRLFRTPGESHFPVAARVDKT